MSDVSKIVIHYKNGEKPLVLKKGLVAFLENEGRDLAVDFADIDSSELPAILRGLEISLKWALASVPKERG